MEELKSKALIVTFSIVPDIDVHTTIVLNSIKAFSRFFDIDVVCLKGEYLSHIDRISKARILRVPLSGDTVLEKIASFKRAVQRQIESEIYEIVHVRSPIEGEVVLSLKEEKGYRVVYEALNYCLSDWLSRYCGDGEREERDSIENRFLKEELSLLQYADCVIVHSESSKKMLQLQLYGIENVEVINYSVSLDHFDWESISTHRVPIIKVFGPLFGEYDFLGFLSAIAKIKYQYRFRVEWYGERLKENIEKGYQLIKERGVEDIVKLGGGIEWERLPLYIAEADIFVLPLRSLDRYMIWGDYPVTLFQCLACKKPVIVTKIPAIEEFFTDGIEIMCYPAGDIDSLADLLLYLLKNPGIALRLAEKGYYKVRNNFGGSVQKRRLLDIYKRIYYGEAVIESYKPDIIEVSSDEITLSESYQSTETDQYKATGELITEVERKGGLDTEQEGLIAETTDTDQSLPNEDTDKIHLYREKGSPFLVQSDLLIENKKKKEG